MSPTGWCSRSGSLPPAASSRRKCDLPEPLLPEHADPLAEPDLGVERLHQPGQLDAQLEPVDHGALGGAAAESRIVTFWRIGTASGGPASSNLRSRVSAAW